MDIDDIFCYLRHCGGTDTLCFDSSEQASLAREALSSQLESHGVAFTDLPEMALFGSQLRLRLTKEKTHAKHLSSAAAK